MSSRLAEVLKSPGESQELRNKYVKEFEVIQEVEEFSETDRDNLLSQLQNAHEKIDQLTYEKAQLESVKDLNQKLNSRLKKLEVLIEEKHSRKNKEFQEKEVLNQSLKKTVERLVMQLNDLECQAQRENPKELKKRIKVLETKNQSLKKQLESLENFKFMVESLQQTNTQLENKYKSSKYKLKKLKTDIKDLVTERNEFEKTKREVQHLVKENEALKEEIAGFPRTRVERMRSLEHTSELLSRSSVKSKKRSTSKVCLTPISNCSFPTPKEFFFEEVRNPSRIKTKRHSMRPKFSHNKTQL